MNNENKEFNEMARLLQGRVKALNSKHPVNDLGEIQKNMSLVTDTFPDPIPAEDYIVCRSVCYDPAVPLTDTERDGTHPHGASGGHSQYSGSGVHSHPDSEGAHVHQVKLPEKMRGLKPGDRVLVVWVGDTPVVNDIVVRGSERL
jgi:hypothetical protein